jgi:hypothetical protein
MFFKLYLTEILLYELLPNNSTCNLSASSCWHYICVNEPGIHCFDQCTHMPSKDSVRLSSTTASDGLFFNAFEDPEPTATASSSPGFMTPTWEEEAVKSPRKGKPTLRRRVSDTAPSSPNGQPRVSAWPLGHSRSQTEQSGNLHPHPLGIGAPDTFAGHSGSTRPHLSRLLSAWESPAGSDVEGERKTSSSDAGSFLESGSAAKDDEKTVLVHEVSLWLSCGRHVSS